MTLGDAVNGSMAFSNAGKDKSPSGRDITVSSVWLKAVISPL